MKKILTLLIISGAIALFHACKKDAVEPATPATVVGTPYNFQIPSGFPPPFIPADNPMTVEGVQLGRFLFYDKRLSRDLSMSCGSCHAQQSAFSDRAIRSTGIHGQQTRRHSMPLFNLAWQEVFFWDGRASSLEEQALLPVTDQIELDNDWPTVVARLETDSVYPDMFEAAFGPGPITKENAARAIAQFERSIVSANSEFDQVIRLGTKANFNDPLAAKGKAFFEDPDRADCAHCHGAGETSFIMGAYGTLNFSNNGLNDSIAELEDLGHEEVSGNSDHRAQFKIPSVRNVFYSQPLMHDGSIASIDSLVEFYNTGSHKNSTTDRIMHFAGRDNRWSPEEKQSLKAFLETLTDYEFLVNEAYQDPFKP